MHVGVTKEKEVGEYTGNACSTGSLQNRQTEKDHFGIHMVNPSFVTVDVTLGHLIPPLLLLHFRKDTSYTVYLSRNEYMFLM